MATVEELQDQVALSERQIALYNEQMQSAEMLVEREEARSKLLQENIRLAKLRLEQLKQGVDLGEETKENLNNIIQIEEKRVKESQKLQAAYSDVIKNTSEWVTELTGVSGQSKGLLASLKRTKEITGSYTHGLIQAAEAINKQVNAVSMLQAGLQKLKGFWDQYYKGIDKTRASFKATTGAGHDFVRMVDQAAAENVKHGISIEATYESITDLRREMSNMTLMTQEAQKELGVLAAQYRKLGVSTQAFAKSQEMLNLSMHMSGADSKAFSKELLDLGTAMGDPNKAFQDFVATAPQLARYGKDAPQMFKNIAIQAKAMGIEMQDLLGIVSQYDTFEGAATSVGKLNAVLGGNYLNSLQLLNATEEERIEILKGVVSQSGKNWEAMSRYEKMTIASAAGITDMAQAEKMWGQNSDIYDANKKNLEEQAKAQKSVEERLIDAMTLQEKYMSLFSKLFEAIAPVLDLLHGFMNTLMGVNEAMGGWGFLILGIPALLAKMGAGMALVILKNKLLAGSSLKAAAAQKAKAAADLESAAATKATASAYAAAAPAILAFGAAIALVGVGMMAAGYGLSMLMDSVSSWEDVAALAVTMAGFAGIIFLFGKAAGTAAGPTIALGAGIALVGVGMLAAGAGLSLFLDGLVSLVGILVEEVVPVALEFSAIILSFATGIGILAVAAVPASIGMTALALGFGALAISLALIKTTDLIAIADIFKSMAAMARDGGAALIGMPGVAKKLVENLEDFADSRSALVSIGENMMLDGFATAVSLVADQMERAATASERLMSSLAGTKGFIDSAITLETKGTAEITKFVHTLNELSEKEAEANTMKKLTEALENLSSGGGGTEVKSAKQPIIIELKIGDRTLKKVIDDYFESNKRQVLGVN